MPILPKKTITIPTEWIDQLQKYVNDVDIANYSIPATNENAKYLIAVNRLVGYLESLDEIRKKII